MKEIYLGKGKVALVDDDDYEMLSKFTWRVSGEGQYAVATIFMHRLVMGHEPDKYVDHINRQRLDNRKQNLRWATKAQNNANRGVYSKTGYRGVKEKSDGFYAFISKHGNMMRFGPFQTIEEAADAYDVAAVEIHGEYAALNNTKANPPAVGSPIKKKRVKEMRYLINRNGGWYFKKVGHGEKIIESLHTTDITIAKARRDKRERELHATSKTELKDFKTLKRDKHLVSKLVTILQSKGPTVLL